VQCECFQPDGWALSPSKGEPPLHYRGRDTSGVAEMRLNGDVLSGFLGANLREWGA